MGRAFSHCKPFSELHQAIRQQFELNLQLPIGDQEEYILFCGPRKGCEVQLKSQWMLCSSRAMRTCHVERMNPSSRLPYEFQFGPDCLYVDLQGGLALLCPRNTVAISKYHQKPYAPLHPCRSKAIRAASWHQPLITRISYNNAGFQALEFNLPYN